MTEDDASYWDLLPEELCHRILDTRDLLYEVDRRRWWNPIHEEMSHPPCCTQHGTVRCPSPLSFETTEPDLLDFILGILKMTATYVGELVVVFECGFCSTRRPSPDGSRIM